MQIEQVHKKEAERIINTMECPKDFICYKSGFEDLCKAKDIGIEAYLECQEKNPRDCTFSLAFGHSYLCRCPLRAYVANKLGK